jgi:predicted component of type VI protein secretion system
VPVPAPAPTPAPATAATLPESPPVAENDNDETRVVTGRHAATWRLVLPDNRQVTVSGAIFLGRNPSSAGRENATVLAVIDPNKSVSKTHAVIDGDGESMWVTDLNSTNGTVVIRLDGTEILVEPNERTQVSPGDSVLLGEYTIQVEHG